MGSGMEGVKVSEISEGTVVELDGKTYSDGWVRVVADPGIGQPYLAFRLPKDKSMNVHLGDRVIISVHVMEPGVE